METVLYFGLMAGIAAAWMAAVFLAAKRWGRAGWLTLLSAPIVPVLWFAGSVFFIVADCEIAHHCPGV